MQIAIKAHLSQSIGVDLSGQEDLSGQHGMSPLICIMGALTVIATLAASGAVTSPAIKKIAISLEMMIERPTED